MSQLQLYVKAVLATLACEGGPPGAARDLAGEASVHPRARHLVGRHRRVNLARAGQ